MGECVTGRRKSVEAPVKPIVHLTHPLFGFASVIRAGDISIKPTRESISHPLDISMAAIILFYCPANNETDATCVDVPREIEKGAHPYAHSSWPSSGRRGGKFSLELLINVDSILSPSGRAARGGGVRGVFRSFPRARSYRVIPECQR